MIPLFLLMGQFATHGGLSKALFRFVGAFLGHHKGGIAMAAIGACAGFGAICGSSLATAATMGQVALPELRRFGYSGSLATGALSLAAANDQTTILELPTWWAVALMVPSFALLCAAGLHTAWQHWRSRLGNGE